MVKKLAEKRPGKLHRRVLFHHDNAPAHSAGKTQALLREFRWEIIQHPPYSPDLDHSDFFWFPNLKKSLKGIQHSSVADVKQAALTWFTSQGPQFYADGLKGWYQRLQKCIYLEGSYVEK